MTLWHALELRGEPALYDLLVAWCQGQEVTGMEEPAPGVLVVFRRAPWDVGAIRVELRRLAERAGARSPELRVFTVEDEDWLAAWKSRWEPTPLGRRLWVVPAWMAEAQVPVDRRRVLINPGMAFGTGTHETTRLAWELLEGPLCVGPLAPETLLDLGAGTGVLALGAAVLERKLVVVATECDPEATVSAAENLALNPEPGSRVVPVLCAGVPVPGGWAGAAVVNMTHAEHEGVRRALVPALAPEAFVVLSGLLTHQAPEQAKWWAERGFAVEERAQLGEWAGLRLRRRASD